MDRERTVFLSSRFSVAGTLKFSMVILTSYDNHKICKGMKSQTSYPIVKDKQALLQQWVSTGENVDAIETNLKISRSQEGELTRGRELLTIDEMKSRGMSQHLILDHIYVLTFNFFCSANHITCACPSISQQIPISLLRESSLLRTKIESVIKRGDGIADPDCPDDPSSTRFWVTTGAKFEDREKVGVSMEATAAVQSSAAAIGQMLAPSGTGEGGCLALTNGSERGGGGPSLEALVGVMTGGAGGAATPAPAAAKAKAKPKAKAKANTSLQNAKTPAEVKDAIRSPIKINHRFLEGCPSSFLLVPCLESYIYSDVHTGGVGHSPAQVPS